MSTVIHRPRVTRAVAWTITLLVALVTSVAAISVTAAAADRDTYNGNLVIREDGVTVSDLDVNGAVIIYGDDVTLRNVTVTYKGYHSIRLRSGAEGTEIYDTVVNCVGKRTNGVVFGGYYAENVTLNDCRNGFMSSRSNPATVVDSTFNGEAVSTQPSEPQRPSVRPTTAPSIEPTTAPTAEPTTAPTAEPTTPPVAKPTPEPTPPPVVEPPVQPEVVVPPVTTSPITTGDLGTLENTGPSTAPTRSSGNITTSQDGQVIEGVTVNGRITVQNDNVTIRDTVVMGTGTYMIFIIEKADGTCPSNVRIERTEINGANAPADSIPVYGRGCGFTMVDSQIHDIGRGIRTASNTTLEGNYITLTRTWEGAHRAGISSHGGTNLVFTNNTILCENTGCSAAITLYGDYAPIDGVLVQGNLMSTTGAYCMYGGSLGSKDYPNGSNVRILDNRFSTSLGSNCGRSGIIAGFDEGVRGNVFSGNIWNETGQPATRR